MVQEPLDSRMKRRNIIVLSQDNLEKKIVRIPEENRQEEKLKTT